MSRETLKKERAFYEGFRDGFASPFLVFGGRRPRFTYRRDDTVEAAWREVGRLLNEAMESEGRRLGKISEKDSGGRAAL